MISDLGLLLVSLLLLSSYVRCDDEVQDLDDYEPMTADDVELRGSLFDSPATGFLDNGLANLPAGAFDIAVSDRDALDARWASSSRKRATDDVWREFTAKNGAPAIEIPNWNPLTPVSDDHPDKYKLAFFGTVHAVGQPDEAVEHLYGERVAYSPNVVVKDAPVVDCGGGLASDACSGPRGFVCVAHQGQTTADAIGQRCHEAGAAVALILPSADTGFPILDGTRPALPMVGVHFSNLGALATAATSGRRVTLEVFQPPRPFYPLGRPSDQGRCGSCYLIAAADAMRFHINLLRKREAEKRGREWNNPEDLFEYDMKNLQNCYQKAMSSQPEVTNEDAGTVVMRFDPQAMMSGDDNAILRTTIQEMSTSSSFAFLHDNSANRKNIVRRGFLSARECGTGEAACVRFTTTVELAQLFIIALSGNGRNSLPVSIGRGSQAATILEIVPKIGASVCDGGWSHLAYKLLFGEQQKFRLGHGNSALPFLKSGDVTNSVPDSAVDASACEIPRSAGASAGELYSFDPFFDQDEAQRVDRYDQVLAPFRPIYSPYQNFQFPTQTKFADSVRSLLNALRYGPVAVSIGQCSALARYRNVDEGDNGPDDVFHPNCNNRVSNHVVTLIGAYVEDLPDERGRTQRRGGKAWYERSYWILQNNYGESWGYGGQAYVRLDFTKAMGKAVMPLVRLPGAFANPFLPSDRLERLRFANPLRGRADTVTAARSMLALESVAHRPALPPVAVASVDFKLVVAGTTAAQRVAAPAGAVELALRIEYDEVAYFGDARDRAGALPPIVERLRFEPGEWRAARRDTRTGTVDVLEIAVSVALPAGQQRPASHWALFRLEQTTAERNVYLDDLSFAVDVEDSARFRASAAADELAASAPPRTAAAAAAAAAAALLAAAAAGLDL